MKIKQIIVCLSLIILTSSCTGEKTQNGTWSTQSLSWAIDNTTLENNTDTPMAKYEAPELQNGDIVANIKTNNGTMTLKLFVEKAPTTTTNFIALAKKDYYNGIIFHRVIPDFMIQGWDPEGTGTGGESVYWEKFEDEFHPDLKNMRGTISMANAWPNTNGSQFFINVKDNNFLDNRHSVFGQVVEWIDVADKISKTKTVENDRPEKEIKMIEVKIEQYQDGKMKEYEFNFEEKMKEIEEAEALRKEANKDRVVLASDTVMAHYKWTLEDGTVFDESYERNAPIEVNISAGQVLPWFGNALIGMKIGDKKTINLTAEEAYGAYDESRTQDVPKAEIQGAEGQEFVAWGTLQSMAGPVKILKVTEDAITVDMNHPLAGKALQFDLELVDFVN